MSLQLHEGGDELQETHEINMTPFIDVMLVLLIIFMVAAPLATVDVKIDLPASTAKPQARPAKPIYLSIKDEGALFLGELAVTEDTLAGMLDQLSGQNKEQTVFVRADKQVDYARLMQVMDALRGSGYLKIGLVGLETVSAP